jgi:hypothetical protein
LGSDTIACVLGGVSVIVAPPLAVTVTAPASRFSMPMSCVIAPARDTSTLVSNPREVSNFGIVTLELQSVTVSGTSAHSDSTMNGVAVAVGVMVGVGV